MSTSTPDARSAASPPDRRTPIDREYPDSDGKPMADNTLQFK
ncbi:MAG: hypothetical protein P4L85_02045 [Paludisphaera borealis]|nr:hypothetical protein [Paludisphaera borealis]MDR3618103.1 hypothetical protein [Paludisphaera borealis]